MSSTAGSGSSFDGCGGGWQRGHSQAAVIDDSDAALHALTSAGVCRQWPTSGKLCDSKPRSTQEEVARVSADVDDLASFRAAMRGRSREAQRHRTDYVKLVAVGC